MAKPLTFEVTKHSCVIPLTLRQMNKLLKIDSLYIHYEMQFIGVSEVEYNGHFGPNFFFSVDKLELAQEVADRLTAILETPLKDLKKEP